jgi:hypothetical protein
VGVQHTYISKVESGKLDFTLYPDEFLVGKLTIALDADDTELPLAKKGPPLIRDRCCNTPTTSASSSPWTTPRWTRSSV